MSSFHVFIVSVFDTESPKIDHEPTTTSRVQNHQTAPMTSMMSVVDSKSPESFSNHDSKFETEDDRNVCAKAAPNISMRGEEICDTKSTCSDISTTSQISAISQLGPGFGNFEVSKQTSVQSKLETLECMTAKIERK